MRPSQGLIALTVALIAIGANAQSQSCPFLSTLPAPAGILYWCGAMEKGQNFLVSSITLSLPALAYAPRTTIGITANYYSAPCHFENGANLDSDKCSYTLTNGSQYDLVSNNNYGQGVATSAFSVAPSQ